MGLTTPLLVRSEYFLKQVRDAAVFVSLSSSSPPGSQGGPPAQDVIASQRGSRPSCSKARSSAG